MKYWDKAWQLTGGCSPISPGCLHCWSAAAAYIRQYQHNEAISAQYKGLTERINGIPTFNGTVRLFPERLDIPLRTRKPTVFALWNDLFHEAVPLDFRLEAYLEMCNLPRHTFLILTKRPQEMKKFVFIFKMSDFPHIWHGLTVCNQQEADEKIPVFLQVPGKKFLSMEPMLSSIFLPPVCGLDFRRLPGHVIAPHGGIDAVIVGCESGPDRRPMKLEWTESVVNQCETAGVPVFVKQLHINGKLNRDMNEWPAKLRMRDLPWRPDAR